ncbi:GNAT family N-acetyltransferase [Streptomyces sp. ME19-01-6]|uniref:GNAT family N-acetyltransferase n=1 Tax=Streptomyces sp. ME19-01-6 TaxID=3028686 RepID=UPI0029A30442|nr:GNAT family N-acetyltransferase [Streptomyces sp. ME19-01-6]MDX3228570.1 GNAT family N-acetyltransferase [Streptomyces sp. ME19-01-6]
MTTTLRPTGPEQRTEWGGRARSYEVCVNGRPVGSLDLTTDERLGSEVGRIERLDIDEPDRHRGRGTVAALAAEEVLRGWGCTQVAVSVPAQATTGLGLAGALGFGERGRNMVKELSEAPELPPGSEVRNMGEAEYPAWFEHERAGYIRDWMDRGVAEGAARAKADSAYATLLPDGPATPGTLLRVLAHGGTDVGTVWVAIRPEEAAGTEAAGTGTADGPPEAYVYAVEVAEEYRGRGHGRTLMLAAERDSLTAGARTIGLHVFGGNAPALRLYESLGYRPTQYHLFKQLL